MNLTFSITHSFEKEFTTTNLVNSDLVIERVSIFTDKRTIGSRVAEGNLNLGYCLMLDTINNMQERRQSPMTCINETYQSDHYNIVVPKTRKWRFYMTDKEGHYITLKVPMYVSIHFSIKK